MTNAPTPPPPSAVRPPAAALSWGLGLLGLLLLPFVTLVISGVVMVAVGLHQSRSGGLARANGRRAADWGLTVLVIAVPCTVVWVVALSIRASGFFPWDLAAIVWLLLGVVTLVVAVVGLVQSSGGRVVRVPAIRFFR
ncbi:MULTISPECIES: DUF4870 domain-containing protein [unclassified Rathayibacter]|uniref:DUF4870 domain-containing protein n=1 Tax=unclassified Rathayibacter TaxID=2609250 RepID=UPI0006FB66FE|nr:MULTISPECIES: DUF4870 domain-containing protein [unclassified Rathayibacter]KQQ04088.1 hypothetical protein ASF42_11760 [Rathayibacter sp. Leaf294]KQS12542.1 hypothetical protein ASG06_11760 [Rathayibacter sp. Leaf185]